MTNKVQMNLYNIHFYYLWNYECQFGFRLFKNPKLQFPLLTTLLNETEALRRSEVRLKLKKFTNKKRFFLINCFTTVG